MLKRNVIGAVSRNNVIVTHENKCIVSPGFSQSIFNRGIRRGIQERRCWQQPIRASLLILYRINSVIEDNVLVLTMLSMLFKGSIDGVLAIRNPSLHDFGYFLTIVHIFHNEVSCKDFFYKSSIRSYCTSAALTLNYIHRIIQVCTHCQHTETILRSSGLLF